MAFPCLCCCRGCDKLIYDRCPAPIDFQLEFIPSGPSGYPCCSASHALTFDPYYLGGFAGEGIWADIYLMSCWSGHTGKDPGIINCQKFANFSDTCNGSTRSGYAMMFRYPPDDHVWFGVHALLSTNDGGPKSENVSGIYDMGAAPLFLTSGYTFDIPIGDADTTCYSATASGLTTELWGCFNDPGAKVRITF